MTDKVAVRESKLACPGYAKRADPPRIPVLMCTWKRPHLLRRTLDQLLRQRDVSVDFFIWNNNFELRDVFERRVAPYRRELNVTLYHNARNLGCFARFLHARTLARRYPFCVVIDDDQRFGDRFLKTLWDDRTPGGVSASYAYRFTRGADYWTRSCVEPGAPIEYCGPGGMIIDSRLLTAPALFEAPQEAWMMDDIWLSYVLNHKLHAPMRQSNASVEMTDRANDTFRSLRQQKTAFLETLRHEGWRV